MTEVAPPPKWKQIIYSKIIPAFPKPWASYGSDDKFEHYVKKALNHLDKLKSPDKDIVYLGEPDIWIQDQKSLDQCKKEAFLPEKGIDLDEVTKGLINFFNGMVDWGHPKMCMNVIPPATLPSIAANLFSSVFSPNLIESELSVNVVAAEIEAIAMCASLAGYDPLKADGIFTFGGLGTWLYAVKVGLTKALGMQSRHTGIRKDAQILTSEVSHFSKLNCADWTGLGMDNICEIPLNHDNSMNLNELKKIMKRCHEEEKPIALIACTTGTTDAFGVDDVKRIVEIRNEFVKKYNPGYIPHVHTDAVIGWAWMNFKNYDFEKNPLEFRPELKNTIHIVASKLMNIHYTDSIGFDFHKTGYTPYISSLFLLKNGDDFNLLRRPKEKTAYLYHFGAYNPGEYSLESSRAASGALAAWANLKYFGIEGYQVLLARLIDAEIIIRRFINSQKEMIVVNPHDHGFVTLFRIYPKGTDAQATYEAEFNGQIDDKLEEYNKYNYEIMTEINRRQREEKGPFMSFTSNHRSNRNDKPIAALKVFPMAPYSSTATMLEVFAGILAVKDK